MTTIIRWGMIGCGDVTEVKSGPALAKADGSALVAVMGRRRERARDFATRHGVARWTDNADEVITAGDVDAVYLSTPTDSHLHYALRCAAAGKPTLVEKPMAASYAESRQMVDAFRAAHLPLWVAYYRRALPRFIAVKDLIDSGAIGQILSVRSQHLQRPPAAESRDWRLDARRIHGGLFMDGACHTLDFLAHLFGPVTEVWGASAPTESTSDDPGQTIVASYRFTSSVLGSGMWCYSASEDKEVNEVIGTLGRITFSTTTPVPIRVLRIGHDRELAIQDPTHAHQPLVQSVVDELRGEGRCPSTGDTAVGTSWVVDQILKSSPSSSGV